MTPTRKALSVRAGLILLGFCGLCSTQALATGQSAGLASPGPGETSVVNKRELVPLIDDIAKRRGVDKALVHAVIAAESGYDPRAVSPKGAIGLMQLMPATAEDYGIASAEDLFDPETNVETGTRHLKRLLGKYKNIRHAVMAYNAGEGALERTQGAAYRETRLYTMQVINSYMRNKGNQPARIRALTRSAAKRPRLMIESTVGNLDPGLHRFGPGTKPIFVLESN
jgi:soluble lytic murein transglycosylase-like protein